MDLFKLWDKNDFSQVQLKEITTNFMTLGFISSEESVLPLFSQYVKEYYHYKPDISQQEYLQTEIPLTEFVKLFNGDEFQQPIINAMNLEVRKKRYLAEEAQKQKEALIRRKQQEEEIKRKMSIKRSKRGKGVDSSMLSTQ